MSWSQAADGAQAAGAAGNRPELAALIFDVDGTLADTEEAHRRAFNRAFRMHGLDWHWSVELYADLLDVTGGQERISHYIDRLPLPSPQREALRSQTFAIHGTKTRVFAELVGLGAVAPRAGIRRLLVEARSAGIRLAIASTTTRANVESLIGAILGGTTLRWFDVIATGNVVRHKKPAPDIYDLALTDLGTSASQSIAFEDSAIGLQAAKAAGLFTVATPSKWTVAQDFSAADLVLPSLADPDQPLERPYQLRIGARYLGLEQLAKIARMTLPQAVEAARARGC
ncbi:MAG TPA: HAD-IA family hydrolase [Steroidobacteraceae bacterium]|nr:HAD-IA family hydrolase [Steroidobacteraceae bacterium]